MSRKNSVLVLMACVLSTQVRADVIDTTPGLLYHLDAAAANIVQSGGSVSAWNDSSGNGNNFSQATASKQPTYVASSPDFNNQPVVQFSGDLTGAGTTAPNASRLVLNNSTTPETVIIVEETTVPNGLAGIWGLNEADTGIRLHDANSWQTPLNGSNGNDYPNSMYINGLGVDTQPLNTPAIMVAYGNVGALSATGLGEYFDCCGAGARPWGGYIAEVAVYSGVLTNAQRDAIESSLSDKYGIAVVPEPSSVVLFGIGAAGLFLVRRRHKA